MAAVISLFVTSLAVGLASAGLTAIAIARRRSIARRIVLAAAGVAGCAVTYVLAYYSVVLYAVRPLDRLAESDGLLERIVLCWLFAIVAVASELELRWVANGRRLESVPTERPR